MVGLSSDAPALPLEVQLGERLLNRRLHGGNFLVAQPTGNHVHHGLCQCLTLLGVPRHDKVFLRP